MKFYQGFLVAFFGLSSFVLTSCSGSYDQSETSTRSQDAANKETNQKAADSSGETIDGDGFLDLGLTGKDKNKQDISIAYLAILGRAPDSEGGKFWLERLEKKQVTLNQVYQAQFDSPEYQNKSGLPAKASLQYLSRVVFFIYYNAFARTPSADETKEWVEVGKRMGPNSEAKLLNSMLRGASAQDKAQFINKAKSGMAAL